MAAGAPDLGGRAAGEVAEVAAAQDGDGAGEAVGEAGEGGGDLGGEGDRVRVGADLGERAVEVEEERVAGGEAEAVEVVEAHAGDAGGLLEGARGSARRHQAMSCSRTVADELLPALAAFLERHGERAVDGVGGGGDVVRVDEERRLQLLGGAGELGEDEDAGVVGGLGGDELLGDEVHAVVERRDEADAGEAVEAAEGAAA